MFDKDYNGYISKNEASELITFFHEFNSLGFDKETVNGVVNAIFRNIDTSNQGSISKQALRKYLEKYQDEDITINPFVKVKTSDAVTKNKKTISNGRIPADQEKELERVLRKKQRSKIRKFWELNKKMILWSIIYAALCISSGFINRSLEGGRQYNSTKAARFFAGIIFFNLACIILFMCINTITLISTTSLKFYLPLNDIKHYHSVCGVVLAIAVIPHVLIHIFGDFSEIAAICARKPKKAYVTVAWLTFANLTGLTGVICLLLFCVMIIVPLIPYYRKKKYEVFLHTHKLFYLAMVALFLHANTPDTKRYPAIIFLSFPLFLFLIELIIRLIRFCLNKTKISRVKQLNSGVVLLEIQKPKKFSFRCGQYSQINIPSISKWEWHPFTIASSPLDDNLYFYINPAGDWTKSLSKFAKNTIGKIIS
jgi:respiratory burst oxidase